MVEIAKTIEISEIAAAGEDSEGDKYLRINLIEILYIRYPITFWKRSVLALLNSSSEVNTIYLIFAQELGLPIRSTDVRTQKIDNNILDIYGMLIIAFSMTNKAN